MSLTQISRNELKHLLHPDKGEWIPEYDPVMAAADACATCVGATTKTIHTVNRAKKCFVYGILASNETADTDATYCILSGATVKIPPIYIVRGDVHNIRSDPRAPILTFGTAEVINVRTGGATINITISFWECEIE